MTGPDLDVAIIGDGPAGLALAASCTQRDLAVAVIGDGRPWTQTYGMWLDDVAELPGTCFARVSPTVVVHATHRHVLHRPYGIVRNDELRSHLARGVAVDVSRARSVQHFPWGSRAITTAGEVDARLVVDAAGGGWRANRRSPPAAWQTAFGIVVADVPPRFDHDAVTFMDLRVMPGAAAAPTFCYVVPLAAGWLVEETVLAAWPAVDPHHLRARLAARLGDDAVEGAGEVEAVTIPLGGRLPSRRGPVVGFGSAAGYVHPATGYSVAASLRAAPRVADAIAAGAGSAGPVDARPVWDAVWPRSARQTRRLHDYGLQVLLRLRPAELGAFFDAFFELPEEVWRPYLRIDASPREVSRAMTAVMRRLPWPVRRRVVGMAAWLRRPGGS